MPSGSFVAIDKDDDEVGLLTVAVEPRAVLLYLTLRKKNQWKVK